MEIIEKDGGDGGDTDGEAQTRADALTNSFVQNKNGSLGQVCTRSLCGGH